MSADAPRARNLCLFDLDHTLIPIDSDHSWGQFLIRLGWVDRAEFARRNDEFYAQYEAGRLDIDGYTAFVTSPLRDRSAEQARAAQQDFMREVIEPQLRPAARELVREHQRQGDLVAIVTATNEFVTAPIAAAFGVEHLIATRLERGTGGTITGRILGTPNYREGKVLNTTQWLGELGADWDDFERVTVYSDSPNDLPLLERASEPVATNPTPALAAVARERGWRILELFA